MHKSSLLEIIRTFNKEDIAKFKDFVKSPYHNKNSNVEKLYTVIKKFAPAFDDPGLAKEEVWKNIFPAKEYNYGIMKNLIHDLSKLAENYMSQINLKRNFIYEKNLIEELRNRNLFGLHKKTLDKLKKRIENRTRDEDYYNNKIVLIQEQMYTEIDSRLSDKIKTESINTNVNLFMFRLIIGTLNLFVEEQRSSVRHENKITKHFLKYIENNAGDFKNENILLIYYNILRAAMNLDKDDYYQMARDAVNKNLSALDYIDKRNIYNGFMVICFRKKDIFPEKHNYYLGEISKLHIEMIKYSLLCNEATGRIDVLIYRNIVIWCLMSKEIKILAEFIEKYNSKVNIESRGIIENYSNAIYCFLNGEFEKCLVYCSKINFGDILNTAKENFWFKNDIKSAEIRCFYELNMFDNLILAADSYKHFLMNAKLMNESSKKADMNFIKHLESLVTLKMDNNIGRIEELGIGILKLNNISNKSWLLEKIEELEKNAER